MNTNLGTKYEKLSVHLYFASLWGSCRNRYPSERMLDQTAQGQLIPPSTTLKPLDFNFPKILKRKCRHNLYLLKFMLLMKPIRISLVYPPLSNTASIFHSNRDLISTKAGWAHLFTGIMDSKNGYYEKPLSTCREKAKGISLH